jgi:hypothetical protein
MNILTQHLDKGRPENTGEDSWYDPKGAHFHSLNDEESRNGKEADFTNLQYTKITMKMCDHHSTLLGQYHNSFHHFLWCSLASHV